MKNHRLTITALFTLITVLTHGQDQSSIRQYIETYKDIAISEMKRTGVPASIKLAQGIHETEAGQSNLVTRSNNHFGIKCKSTWNGQYVFHDDDARGECFRKYNSSEDSYRDHSDFLKNSSRYASLFQLDPSDFQGWAWGLKKAGYATNPKYPQILIRIINEYNLQDFTLIALGKMVNPADQDIAVSDMEKEYPMAGITKESNMGPEPEETVYPSGEFKINDTKVIWVKKGTSYLAIAEQYDISLARLFDFNDRKRAEVADEDQLVFLQRKRKTGASEFHIVKAGETLLQIAQKEALRLESLLEYNSIGASMQPAEGESLSLRTKSSTTPKLAQHRSIERPLAVLQNENIHTSSTGSSFSNDNKMDQVVFHRVQQRESLYTIARKYDVSVNDVVAWNNLETKNLKIGQELKIIKSGNDANH